MASDSSKLSNGVVRALAPELDRFAEVANAVADASGVVLRQYFRSKFEILDKEDFSKFSSFRLVAEKIVSLRFRFWPNKEEALFESAWKKVRSLV